MPAYMHPHTPAVFEYLKRVLTNGGSRLMARSGTRRTGRSGTAKPLLLHQGQMLERELPPLRPLSCESKIAYLELG